LWGGVIFVFFSIPLGPLVSAPLIGGHGEWGFYFVFILTPPAIVLIGAAIGNGGSRKAGVILVCIGAVGSLVGYGASIGSIFGLVFLYAAIKWLKEPETE